MIRDSPTHNQRAAAALLAIGVVLFAYALAGNYVALPGYLRFLARSAADRADVDTLAFVVGAIKTIAWMYSFHVGALCLTLAHALRRGLRPWPIAAVGVAWLVVWSVPGWPAPGAWFYVLFGALNLIGIALALLLRREPTTSASKATMQPAALLFFAFATWDACGLGSAGRMLHPDQGTAFTHALLVSQSSKLMLELVVAWWLLAASGVAKREMRMASTEGRGGLEDK